ncbi:DUF1501 domain-containing protein [Lignipirellula cremea]|uniref:Sulfatase n=1 Tax=Lignipirellula cremea TaxID=2528010 RepID=A0A518DL62_9BACT|nr:DUF1501 domain-containing protein [Lignipirellula cremea]QDU92579.1 hypothetical protein Pla8534_03270 [Lignipirellula cremea]
MIPSRTSRPISRRRAFQSAAALAAAGLATGGPSDLFLPLLPREKSATAAGHASPGKARRCVLVWLDGGPSHLETFDPKPKAPAEVRGPLGTIATRIPGVRLGECVPGVASRLDDFALIRSMTSPLGEHNFGAHYLLSGYRPTPALEYPAFSTAAAQLSSLASDLPAHIGAPDYRVGGGGFSGAGYLPSTARPFGLGADPARPGFSVRDLNPPGGLTLDRIARRREFAAEVERMSQDSGIPAGDAPLEQAFRLLASPAAIQAFSLEREPPAVRERYGRNTVGQCCLLARRLLEQGAPFVTVNHRGWDTHEDLATRLKDGYKGARVPVGLAPSLDRALSALVDDLKDRGLLEETLVVVMGEFGRTPKLNLRGGRDHWPRVFSAAVAGGGVRGGQVIGASDRTGESPQDRPVTPADLVCTLYTLLGIDLGHTFTTADGRPVGIAPSDGKVVQELIG